MKCPICQNNLHKINIVVSTCTNDKCKLWGSSIPNLVLEALTDTKKKLDICVSALTVIAEGLVVEHQVVGHEDDNKIFIAKHTLEQINKK